MPTPTTALDLQRDILQLREELLGKFQRLEIRLQRLETKQLNGLEANDVATHSPLAGEDGGGNEMVEMKVDENVTQPDLWDVELKTGDAISRQTTQQSFDDMSEQQEGQVHFGESAWTFPFVIGLVPAGQWDMTFSILLLLLNLGMQVAFTIIISTDDFMGTPFWRQIHYAKRWRISMAHDYQYLDLAGRSLVSRVCAGDGALILSTTQATLVEQINSFLGLQEDQFEAPFFQPGTLLCMLCMLFWSLCVYKEYRNIWLGLEVVLRIPRSDQSIFRDNTLRSICKGRFKILLFTYLARAAIATLLLGAGIRWLAETTSITDLMLNCVALNAILDIDEFLFAGFTPISIQVAVQNLKPVKMKYGRQRSQLESFGLLILLIGTLLIPYLFLLQPLAESMIAVKIELCGGNQTFVIGRNSETQQNIGLVTKSGFDASDLTITELAVDIHKSTTGSEEPYLFFFAPNARGFDQQLNADMATTTTQFGFCIETEVLQPSGQFYGDPLVEPMVERILRLAAASLGQVDFDDIGCADVKFLCSRPDARLLRMVCGATCGCNDPFASAWHKVPSQGCIPSCLQYATDQLAASTCEDQLVQEEWELFWDLYPDAISAFFNTDVSQSSIYPALVNLSNVMKSMGCSALRNPSFQDELVSRTRWCEGYLPLFRPLAGHCPASCGCVGASPLPVYCPSSCAAVTSA
ncbi:unnamed protein product [Effrenium voratum]|uniref:Uncharacterized protein n=1 Tax=Effrenium voratum TaxID=2562239 RepID=A0AA36IB21_9DINO|nr:unnamed protein product [Effrenium voratum]CAJ1420139.1 unnamed protein product [Effrenium voratum]